jgi:FKBP-type peptidyl-prolyl cis-trans isomerase SlyD
MQVAAQKVVSMHYTLTNDRGEKLDSSVGHEPLAYLHGAGNLIPGLEKALEGKQKGDKLSVKVAPEDGYGQRDDGLIQAIPRRQLKGMGDLRVGMRLQAQSDHGVRVVRITHLSGDMVTIDGNHELAGETLNFDVEITDVRDPSSEELEHGHVHGPGGHHH